MRKCEKCKGPGPCLMDDHDGRYLCERCHSTPEDPFFLRGKTVKQCPYCLQPEGSASCQRQHP